MRGFCKYTWKPDASAAARESSELKADWDAVRAFQSRFDAALTDTQAVVRLFAPKPPPTMGKRVVDDAWRLAGVAHLAYHFTVPRDKPLRVAVVPQGGSRVAEEFCRLVAEYASEPGFPRGVVKQSARRLATADMAIDFVASMTQLNAMPEEHDVLWVHLVDY